MLQKYPAVKPNWIDAETERQMDYLMGVVRAIRNLRTELNCPPAKQIKVIFHGSDARSCVSWRADALSSCSGASWFR